VGKITLTSCECNFYDRVRDIEHKHRLKNSNYITFDSDYKELGNLGCVGSVAF